MKYYTSMIYIHRPFISRQGSRSFAPALDRGYIHARRVCIDSAISISNLLRIYRSTCTLRYANVEVVSIIFSAAIILVFASVASPTAQQEGPPPSSSPGTATNSSNGGRSGVPRGGRRSASSLGRPPVGGNVAAHLDTCCKALADLGHVFQNATRTLEVLLAIKRKWQAELVASTGSKRRSTATSRYASACKKRTMSHPDANGVAV